MENNETKNSIVRMFGKVPEAMLIINNGIYCDAETDGMFYYKIGVTDRLFSPERINDYVDLFDGKSLEESVTHTVPLDDDKAQFLAAACMDLANSTLWLYHHNNQFQDTEFAEVVNNDYPKYQIQVQQEMNGEGERFYLRGWYPLVQKISRECQLKAYEGYKPKEQMTYVNIYLLVYAAMKSLKNGSLSRIMANIEHDSDKIGNLAFYFFTYILEVLEMPL